MTPLPRAFITRVGVVCAAAHDTAALRQALASPCRPFHPVTLFPVSGPSAELLVAQADGLAPQEPAAVTRTHALALAAAREALQGLAAPDAIVLGTTTGGIGNTEEALLVGDKTPERFRWHGLDTVGAALAEHFGVRGPVITLSTACSSAAVALAVARELLRAGLARRVLAGGVDSLCRLTFHGFRQLQLLAPGGTTPLDVDRAGMTVGEGAGFVLLESTPSDAALAELAGCGLSCDAFHATRPHPEGLGAALAMSRALGDAGMAAEGIDYVNLHGTGTVDNDASEIAALRKVFGDRIPALSSTKGMTGHPLAAAGGIETVISTIALTDGLLPANVGLKTVDPKLAVEPVREPERRPVAAVLSNSFGFGGNNASLVLRAPGAVQASAQPRKLGSLRVVAAQCLSAAGQADATWEAFLAGDGATGMVPDAAFAQGAPAAMTRRLKRLPKMALALAAQAQAASASTEPPALLSFGTAWGPLAETQDFLRKLFETQEQFSSPTDFVGSVHNAPAGQIALLLGAHAPNLTCSSGDRSFEHALLNACLLTGPDVPNALILAAEAWQADLSPLLDPAAAACGAASDGGGSLWVANDTAAGVRIGYLAEQGGEPVAALHDTLARLGGPEAVANHYGAIFVGLPAREGQAAAEQLRTLRALLPDTLPVIAYRQRLGQHASVAATAAVMAHRALLTSTVPSADGPAPLARPAVLMLTLGSWLVAWEMFA
jgi:3-oxoacyl-[acyl-carrier-protein] synthase-1/3-oxoacyl-[acyl-carrier-protein] synthase II